MTLKKLTLSLFLLVTISIWINSIAFCQTPGTQTTPTVASIPSGLALLDEKFLVTGKQPIERTFLIKALSNVTVELNVLQDDKPTSENLSLGIVKIGGVSYKKGKPINVILLDEDNYKKMKETNTWDGVLTQESFSKQGTISFNAQDTLKPGRYYYLFFFPPKKGLFQPKSTVSLKLTIQNQ